MAVIKDLIIGADGFATVLVTVPGGAVSIRCATQDADAAIAAIRESGEQFNPVDQYFADGSLHAMPPQPSHIHIFNWAGKQWEDPRTLADLKAAKWEQVKAQRDAAEFGLFQWTGHSFDGDEAAQRRINLAVMGAQAALIAGDTAWSVDWTLADNTSLTLSASDMMGVANALGANIAQAHTTARAKRQQIEQATTNGELETI